jgi:hypothetical protein
MGWKPQSFEWLFLDETFGGPMRVVVVLAPQTRSFDRMKLTVRRFGRAKAGNWHCREKAARYPEVAQFVIRDLVKRVERGAAAIMIARAESVTGDLTNEVYNEVIAQTLTGVWRHFPTARPIIDVHYGQVWEEALREALASSGKDHLLGSDGAALCSGQREDADHLQ